MDGSGRDTLFFGAHCTCPADASWLTAGEKDHTVDLVHVVDLCDRRMRHGPGRARLAQETAAAILVGGELLREDLQRDGTLEFGVERPVDDAHPALAQDLVDTVVEMLWVHDDEVGLQIIQLRPGFVHRSCFPTHLQVALRLQQGAVSPPHEGMIIHDVDLVHQNASSSG